MSSSESEDIFDASRSPNTDDDTLPQLSDQQQSSSASSMSSHSRSSGGSAPTTVMPVKEKKPRTAEEVEMQKQRTQQSLMTKNANKERAKAPELQAKVKKAMSGITDLQKSHEQIVTCNHKHAESMMPKEDADGIVVAKNNYGPGACICATKIEECFEKKLTAFFVKAQCVSDENADALASFLADHSAAEWPDHILWRRKNNPGAKDERNKTQKDKSQFHKMDWTPQAFLTVLKRGTLVSPLQMICICEKANDKEFVCINPWHFLPKNQSLNPSPHVVLVTACDQPKTAGAFDQQQVVGQSAVVPSGKPAASTTKVGDRSSLSPASSTIVQHNVANGPQQQQHQNNLQISTNPSPYYVEPAAAGTVNNCHLLHGSSNQMLAQVAATDFRHHQYQHQQQPQQQQPTITNANNAFSTDWQCQLQGMQTSTTMSPPYSQAHAGQQQPCWYDNTLSYNNVPSTAMVTSAPGSVPGYVAIAASAYNTPHIVHCPQQDNRLPIADIQQQAVMVSWPMNAGHHQQQPTTVPAPATTAAIATTTVVGQQQQQMFVTGPQLFAPTTPYNNNNNLAPTNGQQPIMMMGSSGQFQGGQSTTTIVYHQPQPQQQNHQFPHVYDQQQQPYQQQRFPVTNLGQQPSGLQQQQQLPIPPHQQMPYPMNFAGHFQTYGTQQGGIGMNTSSSSHQQPAEPVEQSTSAGTSHQQHQQYNSANAGNRQQYWHSGGYN